ncbi:MAG: hypothetical protein H6760_00730 [Candidatus Nomurabacteria bacterium]|nr:MAG: hypothetical protein H6760_00730 [Candidatus Nomurabacteria bacterium]
MSFRYKKFVVGMLTVFLGFGASFVVSPASAQTSLPTCSSSEVLNQIADHMQLNVALPGITNTVQCLSETGDQVKTIHVLQAESGQELSTFVRGFYVYFVWIVGILAVVMTMYAGIQWLTAAGNTSRIENAKSTMNGALIGLVLTLTSYVILQAINPDLVTLRVPFVEPVETSVISGTFCPPAQQTQAENSGLVCGEQLKYSDANGAEHFCLSSACRAADGGTDCLPCTGDGVPYVFCKDRGYTCGYYDSFISVGATITNLVPDKELKSLKLYRTNPNALEDDNELPWKLVKEFNADQLTEGAVLEFTSDDSVPLIQFKFSATFRESFWSNRDCDAVNPDGSVKQLWFELPYAPGSVVHQDFTFDIQGIYNNSEGCIG